MFLVMVVLSRGRAAVPFFGDASERPASDPLEERVFGVTHAIARQPTPGGRVPRHPLHAKGLRGKAEAGSYFAGLEDS